MSNKETQGFEFTVIVNGSPAQVMAVRRTLTRVVKEAMAADALQSAFIGHAAFRGETSNVMCLPVTPPSTH